MARQHAVRLQDVAERAGVSLATASRVLNSRRSYGGKVDLRERVLASAAELGYTPNLNARALASATSMTVGLVLHDVRDAYFALIAGAVVRAGEAHGVLVTIVCTYRDPVQELKYVSLLRAQRPRAILMAGSEPTNRAHADALNAELARYTAEGGRVVSMGGDRGVGHTVVLENYGGARALAHRLVELGHERFAVVTGNAGLMSFQDRLRGFRQGLRDRGLDLPPESVLRSDATREGGIRAAAEVAALTSRPTCAFGVLDVVAGGLIAGLRQLGVDVPGQMSVAGFGDIPMASEITPTLTTVSLPLALIGKQAVELALTDGEDIRRSVSFAATVVLRQSTGSPAVS